MLSFDIVPFSPEDNIATVREALGRLPADCDLVALPELFSTGYDESPEALHRAAEPCSGSTVAALMELSRQYNVALAGSFLARSGNDIYNRGFFVEPSGDYQFYDKRHLFGVGRESKFFCAGNSRAPLSVRFRGWEIALVICYDLRFPVWCRTPRDRPYDLLLVPANWPDARAFPWQHLLIARAIENQSFVVRADRRGSDSFGKYDDLSFVFDFLGRSIGAKTYWQDLGCEALTAICSAEKLSKFRTAFPALADADYFCISKNTPL